MLTRRLLKYLRQFSVVIDFGQKNHDKYLSTYGTGLTDSLLEKQAKMLFEHQLKTKLFHNQMKRLSKKDHQSGFDAKQN